MTATLCIEGSNFKEKLILKRTTTLLGSYSKTCDYDGNAVAAILGLCGGNKNLKGQHLSFQKFVEKNI